MSEPELEQYLNTRHRDAALRLMQEEKPTYRLGRRESEPHSFKINYIHDVLSTNFPEDRTFWDLHHYFTLGQSKLDLQFDISYFRNFRFKDQLSSYDEQDHDMRRPTMAINILSKSTYNSDLGITAENCMKLQIPAYVTFSDHIPEPEAVKAPFLKVYYQVGKKYAIETLSEYCCTEGEEGIDQSKTIDVLPDILPFKFGIMKLNDKYWKKGIRYDLFQLVFIDRETRQLFKTKAEIEKERADKEKERADKEKERADKEKERADKEKERADKAEQRIKELESQLKELKK